MTNQVEIRECPNCQADVSQARAMLEGHELSFCLRCKFPLVLVANKYRLEEVIEEGGFGIIYRARHIHLQRDAERVIKVIKPEVFKIPGMKRRFYQEVQLTSALSQQDEHIVRIYDDFGELKHFGHFYVMEMLHGTQLSALLRDARLRLRKQKPKLIPLHFCFHIFKQLCETMYFAHQEGIVHRDLKPDNIFLVQRKEEPYFLKVLDFGIAKPINQEELKTTNATEGALGTPYYMAPEQAINQGIDARTDIYAMGCVLYEMLTGYAPFQPTNAQEPSPSLVELLNAHITKMPIPPHDLLPTRVSKALSDAVCQALAKSPDDRYQDARGFLEHLRPLMPTEAPDSAGDEASPLLLSFPGVLSSDTPNTGAEVFRKDQPLPTHHTPTPLNDLQVAGEPSTPQPISNQDSLDDLQLYQPPARRPWPMILFAIVLTIGLSGGFYLFGRTPPDTSPANDTPPSKDAPTRKRSLPTPTKPPTTTTNAAATPPKHRKKRRARVRESSRKVRSHRRKRRRRRVRVARLTKARKRALPRPVVAVARAVPTRRRPLYPTPIPGCPPASPGVKWIRLDMNLHGVRIRVIEGAATRSNQSGRHCLGINKRIKILLDAPDYRPCTLAIRPRHARMTIVLKKVKLNDLELDEAYCLQRR